ncbi:MAG: zinc-binding alcohol dehydrogenase [Verrucomicrobiota bacterium]
MLRAASGHGTSECPWRAGYCNVGVVEDVGPGVTLLRVGDRVASTGPHASRFLAAEQDCAVIPAAVSDDGAAFATIAQIVMQGVRLSTPCLGENAVVCGLGLLGQMTLAFARQVGYWPVIGVDLVARRRALAVRMGASVALEPAQTGDFLESECQGQGSDVVFEVTGNPQAIPAALGWVRPRGRLVLVGSPSGVTTMDFHDLVNAPGTVIIGAHNYTHPTVANNYNRWTRLADTQLYLALAAAGRLRMEPLITHRFLWPHAGQAYDLLLHDPHATLAVVLDWTKG